MPRRRGGPARAAFFVYEYVWDDIEIRDTMAVRAGGTPFYNPDQPEVIARWASRLDEAALASLTHTLAEAHDRLSRFVSGRLVMDAVLADVARKVGKHATV